MTPQEIAAFKKQLELPGTDRFLVHEILGRFMPHEKVQEAVPYELGGDEEFNKSPMNLDVLDEGLKDVSRAKLTESINRSLSPA